MREASVREAWSVEFPLAGPGGEPVNLERTFRSHGLASLPPMRLGEKAGVLEVTLPVYGFRPRTVLVSESRPEHGIVNAVGPPPEREEGERLFAAVRRVLRLDEDLSGFYSLAAGDPDLSWVTRGAGRMVRSPTVFEEVVKTLCTTNCAWSATTRMVSALVEHLGEKAPGAPPTGPWGRAFPTPEAMAGAGEEFYRDLVRAGYRGRYLLALSSSVDSGELDLESLDEPPEKLPDDELERRLLALPGVGPYATAHVMMMLGRYSRLVLDSWTRPTYARLVGRDTVPDLEIEERFSGFGPYRGLAFWLYLTQSWIEEDPPAALRAL
ncbi:MAG: Fe-S cluster assembly protein HesB [Actinobacteria bacterium]|nr:Fe-S cluster assembly protein HesB [Actinomycetota bacterium]